MLTFTDKVSGVAITKTAHQVRDLTGRTVTGPDGRSQSSEFLMIGGVKVLGNNVLFLDSYDANKWGANNANLVVAFSNDNLALYTGRMSGFAVVDLESDGRCGDSRNDSNYGTVFLRGHRMGTRRNHHHKGRTHSRPVQCLECMVELPR